MLRFVFDQMAHKRLRHACIHAVHAHVIRVVSAPSERKLAQVSRADQKPAVLVGKIHQNLRAFACLRIFVGYILHAWVVPDVAHVPECRVADRDLQKLRAKGAHQITGIVIGAARCAEAGHCDAKDIFRRLL